jgi:hypothetical protein
VKPILPEQRALMLVTANVTGLFYADLDAFVEMLHEAAQADDAHLTISELVILCRVVTERLAAHEGVTLEACWEAIARERSEGDSGAYGADDDDAP